MNIKKLIGIGLIFFALGFCSAQSTAISALVTDSDGINWFGGTWKITFVPNSANPDVSQYNINGTPLSNSVLYQNGVMDSGGNLSFSIYQNTAISPANSSWTLTVCPNAVTQCGVYNFSTSTTTLNLSSVLTTIIPPPRFHGVANTYGYTDSEAVLQLVAGNSYFNVTDLCWHLYNGTTWGPVCGAAPPSGTCGSILGDNSSTNCGYNNRNPDTAITPAQVSTFGSNLLDNNKADLITAIGTDSGEYLDTIATLNTIMGNFNMVGSVSHPCQLYNTTVIGVYNINPCPLAPYVTAHGDVDILGAGNFNTFNYTGSDIKLGDIITFGDNNFELSTSTVSFGALFDVCQGIFNCTNLRGADNSNLIGIGDSSLSGYNGNGAETDPYTDVIGIGDASAFNLNASSHNIVGIGINSAVGCFGRTGCTPSTSTMDDIVAIGDGAGVGLDGSDVVALGDEVVTGNLTHFFTGHDAVVLGNHACRYLTTGIDNICIGDYAGAIGSTDSAVGNSLLSGINNVIIGNEAGPNTSTQLSNTVAIGFNANTDQSNEVVIGNPSITKNKAFGCPSGQVVLTDGSGTCIVPSSGSGVNGAVYTTSWTLVAGQAAQANCSSPCTATLPASIATGFSGTIVNVGTANMTIASGGPAYNGTTLIPPGTNLGVWTDGTSYHSSIPTFTYFNQVLCTPPNSTDSNCTGTFSLPAAYADNNYGAGFQDQTSTGSFVYTVITGKSASTISYTNTCSFNCTTVGTVTADIWTKHN
jgi:hypothetical protein